MTRKKDTDDDLPFWLIWWFTIKDWFSPSQDTDSEVDCSDDKSDGDSTDDFDDGGDDGGDCD